MEKDWVKIKTYATTVEAEFIKQLLSENDIPAVVLNKQDIFIRFGKVELYVHQDLAQQAIDCIEQNPQKDS